MDWDFYLITKVGGIAVFIFGGAAMASKSLKISFGRAVLINALAILAGFCVSRSWYLLQHQFGGEPYWGGTFIEYWNEAGSVLYGWILGASVTVYWIVKRAKLDVIAYTDQVAPWALIGQFMNRLGCMEAGCCYGKGFSLAFLEAQRPELRVLYEQLGRQPVQLYEAMVDLSLFTVLLFLLNKKGRATWVYFVGYASARFFLEFLRGDNQPALWFMTVPQVTSVLILIVVFRLKNKILL